MWRSRPLASQILMGVLGILLATVSAGALLYVKLTGETLDAQYEQRALGIANAVAQMEPIREALPARDPGHVVQSTAEQVRLATGAAYVVVTDRTGLRYSHTNVDLIGRRLEEPVAALDGQSHLGIDDGSLGRSANARVPLRGPDGTIAGQISVGILEEQVSSELAKAALWVVLYSALALTVGVVASWLLARRIKRVTFGLEPSEIVALLQEREAMLHGIREGVLGLDPDGRIEVVNDEARRLLAVTGTVRGRTPREVLAPGRLLDLLEGTGNARDEVVLTDEFLLVVNKMPVVLSGRNAGSVITLRDRTELEGLMRELHAVTGLTNALRAQEHEFSNRLHVLSGLLGVGDADEAARYLAEISQPITSPGTDLRSRIAPPELAALLAAKVTVAAERDVLVTVSRDSRLDLPTVDANALVTVLGNLIDNAVDAVAGCPEPRTVVVRLRDADGVVRMSVHDSGPGIPEEALHEIFADGFSTKSSRGSMRRGLGLALVHRLVRRAGGTITVTPGPGARFEVSIPGDGHHGGSRLDELEHAR
ncbi:sensor histidine kinase [Amycolatopsis sp. K13G38]|uniref:histidine kinase n=1 Tax=Amycolatopsis acididurans TaxID=2724524 RepID=A0ABX1J9Y9_9PSEU|nr:sensor histidine kinase [Amycolatopsis acididurans]NKQ56597.1 sensor histidine kinase [Amycolatopsis acididurans]